MNKRFTDIENDKRKTLKIFAGDAGTTLLLSSITTGKDYKIELDKEQTKRLAQFLVRVVWRDGKGCDEL